MIIVVAIILMAVILIGTLFNQSYGQSVNVITHVDRADSANADSIRGIYVSDETPEDGETLTFESDSGYYIPSSTGAGATAYDDIGDPDGDGSIGFGSHTGTYTSATAGWNGITISNTVADVGATDAALLSLEYTDDDDEDAVFMVCMDSTDAEDTTIIIGTDGIYLARRHADSALVTKGYGDANWSAGGSIKWLNDSLAAYAQWGIAYDADDSFYVDATALTGWGLTVTSNVLEIDSTDLDDAFSKLYGDTYYGIHDFSAATMVFADGAFLLNEVGNPDENVSFACGQNTVGISSSNNGWGGVTFSNSYGSLFSSTTLLKLTYDDDGDEDGHYLVCLDNSAADTMFLIDYDGAYMGPRGDGSTLLLTSGTFNDSLDAADYLDGSNIADQAIKGDDVDSTSEDFVFNDAYRIDSGEADSMLVTFWSMTDEINDSLQANWATFTAGGSSIKWWDSAYVYIDTLDGLAGNTELKAWIDTTAVHIPVSDSADGGAARATTSKTADSTVAVPDSIDCNGITANRHVKATAIEADTIYISGDLISDFAGTALSVTSNVLGVTADAIDATQIDETDDYTWTGTHDWTSGVIELPNGTNPTSGEAQPAYDTDDDAIEIDSRLIGTVQYIEREIAFPHYIQDSIDAARIIGIHADWAPHGVTVISCGIATDNSSTYSVDFEEWTDPATFSSTIESAVATSSSYEAEDDGSIDDASVAAGSIIYVDLPTNTDGTMVLTAWVSYYINPGD